jgi:hypothetical protein
MEPLFRRGSLKHAAAQVIRAFRPYLIEWQVLVANQIGAIHDARRHGTRLEDGSGQIDKIFGCDDLVDRALADHQGRRGALLHSGYCAVGEKVMA